MPAESPPEQRDNSWRDLPAPSLGLDRGSGAPPERRPKQRSIGFLMLVVALVALFLAACQSRLGTIGLLVVIYFGCLPYYMTRAIVVGWKARGQPVGRGDWITLFYCCLVVTFLVEVPLLILFVPALGPLF
jgi:hypothetical protein